MTDRDQADRARRPADRAADHRRVHRRLADGGLDDEFFRTVIERVGVGVAVYDESGAFTYVNDAFADVLGLDRDAVVGLSVWDVNPAFEAERFGDYWDSFDVGETREYDVQHAAAGDDPVPVETVTTAIEVDGSVYHVGTVADATERVEDWAEIQRQDERLAEVASVISHDLRNPLNVAMGRAELAAMDCDSEHLEYVERSLEKMETLISDVLVIARKGSRITDPEPTDLERAEQTAWYEIADDAAATFAVVDDLGTVASEDDRLAVLFERLLENAVVHAGPDAEITVGRLEDGFYVADDGPGIPADDREDAFEYGYTTREEATGFGLTVVEHVAAAHGWSVAIVESDSGGARVEVRDVDFLE